ncbi:hypothetical protein C3L33_10354, partial [Rhododendron williamsianum]
MCSRSTALSRTSSPTSFLVPLMSKPLSVLSVQRSLELLLRRRSSSPSPPPSEATKAKPLWDHTTKFTSWPTSHTTKFTSGQPPTAKHEGFHQLDEQQQMEAEQRAKLVHELMIDNAPNAIVGLFGQKEYEQCAMDLYYFLQMGAQSGKKGVVVDGVDMDARGCRLLAGVHRRGAVDDVGDAAKGLDDLLQRRPVELAGRVEVEIELIGLDC